MTAPSWPPNCSGDKPRHPSYRHVRPGQSQRDSAIANRARSYFVALDDYFSELSPATVTFLPTAARDACLLTPADTDHQALQGIHALTNSEGKVAFDVAADADFERTQYVSGVVLAIVGTFFFAMKSIFIKFAFNEGVNATTLLTLRMGLSLPFYVVMLGYLRRQRPEQADEATPITVRTIVASMTLGFLGYYLASYLDMSGLQLITAQLERMTLFTYPTIVAVLAWTFLGETINRRIIISLVLCYFGLYLMYAQEKQLLGGQNVGRGVLLVMGAALSYSVYVLLAKPIMQRVGSRQFTSLAMIGSTGFVFLHFLITQPISNLQLSRSIWIYASLIAFLCTVIPSFLVNEAIVRLGATRTTLIGSVGPVVTMLLAIGLLGEPASPISFAGMFLVVVGVAMVAKKK